MSDPIDSDDRLYDPPLVDCIYFDLQRRGCAVTFVPSDDASTAMTEFILIGEMSPDYTRIRTFWTRIEELLESQVKLDRIIHAGGGDYTIHFTNGSTVELSAVADAGRSAEISDRLKQIADAAQIAFLDRTYTKLTPRSA